MNKKNRKEQWECDERGKNIGQMLRKKWDHVTRWKSIPISKLFFAFCLSLWKSGKCQHFFFIFNTYWKLISLMPYYVNIDSSLFISNLILNKSNSTIEWSTFFEAQAFMSIFDTFNRSSALKKSESFNFDRISDLLRSLIFFSSIYVNKHYVKK